ncbi:hypothetical protein HHX47_DHR5000760 [Lentinula edodes]|nr:hypothetical protein HHX47_DHR5000760 [Lentinula edodes]
MILTEAKNSDYEQVGRRLITRCAASLSREQELSAPEVISYLMGWGDRYISHFFVPMYLDGLLAALRQTFVALQSKKWIRITNMDGTPGAVEARWDSVSEAESVRLTSESGKISIQNQLSVYGYRGEMLGGYNLLSFFCDTYEQHHGHATAAEASSEAGSSRASPRHRYLDNYCPKHACIVRQRGDETMPQFVGRWFPRNDREEDQLLYRLMLLAVLKPWRKLPDIVEGFQTVDEAWKCFLQESHGAHDAFLENVQYFYHCSDQSSLRCEKEYSTYQGPLEEHENEANNNPADVLDEALPAVVADLDWSEAEIIAAQEAEKGQNQRFGDTAMEHAYDAGVFNREYEQDPTAILARRCSALDKVQYAEWADQLKDYAANGTVVESSDGLDLGSGIQQLSDSVPGVQRIARMHNNDGSDVCLHDVLNEEQGLFYDVVADHLKAAFGGLLLPQLLMILRGPGGTGKTVAINAVTELFQRMGIEHQLAKTATSGVAATLISGRTVHTWAGVPVGGPRGVNWLEGSIRTAQKRELNIGPVEYLIIDEDRWQQRIYWQILVTLSHMFARSSKNQAMACISEV